VPKAMPGSMVITRRLRNRGGSSQGGVTQKLSPTRRDLMNRFQECSQFSCLMIFHSMRVFCRCEESRPIAPIYRSTSRRNLAPARGAAKKASKPFFLRTTPGAPRSIKKFDSASIFAGLVRIDSCDQDCATSFYATGKKSDQFAAVILYWRTHRGDAEHAEKKVFSNANSARSAPLW